jgi:hypothetical protein
MVTIPLNEYNDLRDKANDIMRMYDRLHFLESRMREIDRMIEDLETRKVNK